jgi:hypothetical protein
VATEKDKWKGKRGRMREWGEKERKEKSVRRTDEERSK